MVSHWLAYNLDSSHRLQFSRVTSHKESLEKVLKNYPVIIPHFHRVMENTGMFKTAAIVQALELEEFYIARNTLLIIVFNLDVMEAFSQRSLEYQSNDQCSK